MTAGVKPTLNLARRCLLLEVGAGNIYRSAGGCDMKMVRRGQNQRVERRLRELVDAQWVVLGEAGRFYELTPLGERDLAAAIAAYETVTVRVLPVQTRRVLPG